MLSAQLSHDLKLMSLVVESVRENGQQVDVLNISVSYNTLNIFPRERNAAVNLLCKDTSESFIVWPISHQVSDKFTGIEAQRTKITRT